MSPFGCFRPRHVPPSNPAWTPTTGDEIEQRYRPIIAAHDARRGGREDYSLDQWHRFQVWIRLLDGGLSLRHLLFARYRAESDAPVSAVRRSCWGDALDVRGMDE